MHLVGKSLNWLEELRTRVSKSTVFLFTAARSYCDLDAEALSYLCTLVSVHFDLQPIYHHYRKANTL